LIDEDPGNDRFAAGIWLFDPRRPGNATRLFEADVQRFVRGGGERAMTEDEEQSGILEVTDAVMSAPWFDAARRYYLGVVQVHSRHPDPALLQYGQLYLISGPAGIVDK
jgi:hypothetical protein